MHISRKCQNSPWTVKYVSTYNGRALVLQSCFLLDPNCEILMYPVFATSPFCAIFCFAAFDVQISFVPQCSVICPASRQKSASSSWAQPQPGGGTPWDQPHCLPKAHPSSPALAPSLDNLRVLLTGGWITAGWVEILNGTQHTIKCITFKEWRIIFHHDQRV